MYNVLRIADLCRLWPLFQLAFFRPNVIVRKLDSNITGVSPFTIQVLPKIIPTASPHDDIFQRQPTLANQLGPSIIVEDRYLQPIVVRRVMNGETEFLVPESRSVVEFYYPVKWLTISVFDHLSCLSQSSLPPCRVLLHNMGPVYPWIFDWANS